VGKRESNSRELLLASDSKGNTACHMAAYWGKQELLEKIWQWATKNLTAEELSNKLLLGTDN